MQQDMPRVNFDAKKSLKEDFDEVIDREAESNSKVLRALMKTYIHVRNQSSRSHSEIIQEMKKIE